MKIASCYRPEECASRDTARPHVTVAHLDLDDLTDPRVVATDGRMMIAVPVVPEDGDTSGSLSPDALAAARKVAGKQANEIVLAAGKHYILPDGTSMPRKDAGRFPSWRTLMPAYKAGDPGTVTIGFDARLLARLVKAMGVNEVILTFPLPEPDAVMVDPIRVTASNDAIGVLMPVRWRK